MMISKPGQAVQAQNPERLFPPHLLHAAWIEFPARGYSAPVTGVIYRHLPRPSCGMPLGGLDTGCIDIEPNGMLGYSTIFNHLVNPRLLLNLPFLGLSVGDRTWVLISDKKGKEDRPIPGQLFPPLDYTPGYFDIGLEGVEIAEWIDYWGHYPILDMEFQTRAPISVGVRAWSPFLPGDTKTSMMPGIVFEVRLRNESEEPQRGTFAFSFPGFETPAPASTTETIYRQALDGTLNGLHVASPHKGDAWEMSYVLAAVDESEVRLGGPLKADGAAWALIAERLPVIQTSETGTTLAHDFTLQSGQSKTLRLVFTWHAPHWKAGGAPSHTGSNTFTHMYARHYPSALAAAEQLARDHDTLLKRIISWQEAIYYDPDLPGWLGDSLINILHLIPECSIWGQAKKPIGGWCKPQDGLFGMNECPRGCPQIECIPCSFYGNIPLVYFFPDAALSTLRGYKAYQSEDGRPPWIFGGVTAAQSENTDPYELSKPDRGYQVVLNGACYIVMADRYWRVSGDDAFLREFWDSLKRANDYSLNLRPEYELSQIMAMPTPGSEKHPNGDTEWFEAPEPGWKGYVTHAGGIRMAQVRIMRRMAEAVGDEEYGEKCDAWLDAGAKVLEEHLWADGYYLNFNEPETGQKSDLIFGYQFDGEWIANWHGVPGVFPKERVEAVLETLRRINCRLSQSGAVNYANPDGTAAEVGGYGTYSYFPPELMMLAMNFMYEEQKDFGLELLHKCMHNVVCRWGYTWDAPNTTVGHTDSGERKFGADYYQDMMLWAVPAALRSEDLKGPCKPGGLVDRIVRAAPGAG